MKRIKYLFIFFGMSSLLLSGCNAKKGHVHKYVDHAEIAATCTKEGTEAYASCEGCDKLFDISHQKEIEKVGTIAKIPHDYVDHPAVPSSCDHPGNIAYAECSMCHKLFSINHKKEIDSVELPQLPHHIQDVAAKEPTCSEEGWIAHAECVDCGKVFALDHETELTDYLIEKLPHTFVDHPASEATCAHAGNIAYAECSVCNAIFDSSHEHEITDNSHIIPALPHNLEHHEAVPFDHIEYWECSICHQKYADAEAAVLVDDVSDAITSFDILNDNVKNYLGASTESAQIEALSHPNPFNDQIQKQITWAQNGNSPYRVELSTTSTFDEVKTYNSNTNSLTLPGVLIPGQTYYYRVFDNDNVNLRIAGFTVDNTYCVRTLKVDGVSNVRDDGGWTAKDGNTILYNKIIRGGRLTYISAVGKETLLGELGVKTEIDLRAGSGGSQEVTDSRLTYRQIGLNQYTMLVPDYTSPEVSGKPAGTRYGFDTTTPVSVKNIFEVLANANSYPVYYHCNAGADRTGSITYLINGLLGVSYEDLVKDFELTTFSAQGNRFRSGIQDGHWVTSGDMAGIYECDADNYVAFGKLHELISTKYAQSNGELCSAIEMYLKKVCDVSDETIAAVRRNLLGKDVAFDPVVIEEDKTFTPTNGNWTIHNQLTCETGTFHGSECYKFTTNANSDDHYIYNNLALIQNDAYKTFHFEIYIPDTSAKWSVNSGCRFAMSIKPNGGSTHRIEYSEDYDNSIVDYNHIDIDTWCTVELDITGLTNLARHAFYLPYGSADRPVEIYLRNVYVY